VIEATTNSASMGATGVRWCRDSAATSEVSAEFLMADQPGQKATVDFYNGFLAVIYGLLVSKGLENSVVFLKDDNRDSVGFPLFLGTFLTSLHFWFTCSKVDDPSEEFYLAIIRSKTALFKLLILIDVSVSTLFALLVLGMFNTIPDHQLFKWFVVAGGISLASNVSYGLFLWCADKRWHRSDNDTMMDKYWARVNSRIKTDVLFVSGAFLIWYWQNGVIAHVSYVFPFFVVFLLLMDVGLFQELPSYFSSRRGTGRSKP
jgi:hypothetical protein